jgi:hypothetical protein
MNNKILYKDSVIEVKILTDSNNESLKSIALRYIKPPIDYKDKNGNNVLVTNAMGGETDWFVLPHTFGTTIGKKLFEQYSAGLLGFDKKEIKVLRNWLIEMEIIDDVMCY